MVEPERVSSPTTTLISLDAEEGWEPEGEPDPAHLESSLKAAVEHLEDERLKNLVTQLKDLPPEDEDGRCNAMQQLLMAVLEDVS